MIDRFILASSFKRISERFNMASLVDKDAYNPSYNITNGDKCYVITNPQTKEIQQFEFGLRLHDLQTLIPFVRAEGDRNIYDDRNYTGSKAIFLKPEFKKLIREQRCLVLSDAFVVGVEAMNPYLVYLRDKKRPFAFAGIWSSYKHELTGDKMDCFAIITTTANMLMQDLGYKRMPVILFQEYESRWLRLSTQLSELLDMLSPYPYNLMNAYPISIKIADKTINDILLIQPFGSNVYNENFTYKRMSRLGKKESGETKVHVTLEQRMKPGK